MSNQNDRPSQICPACKGKGKIKVVDVTKAGRIMKLTTCSNCMGQGITLEDRQRR